MWFAIGFGAACAVALYLLQWHQIASAAVITVVFLAAAILCAVYYSKSKPAAAALTGALFAFIWIHVFNCFYLAPIRSLEGQNAQLTIHITDYSWQTDYGTGVDGYIEVDGKYYHLNAYINEKVSLKPGDTVIGSFRLRNTTGDAQGETTHHMGKGIYLLAYPKSDIYTRFAPKIPWYGIPAWLAEQIRQLLHTAFPADTLPFAQALLLGDTSLIDYSTDTSFKISGIRHVIAVSGLHVTILFSLVYQFTGRKRVMSAVVGIPVLILFAAVAGFTPSITRSCIMHGLMIIATLFERDYDPPTALSFAVLCILGVNPYTISSVGFQLSVGCLIGIFLFSSPINAWLMDEKRLGKRKGKQKRFFGWLSGSVSVSLSATVITTPLCGFYFGTVSLIGVLTNLLTLWVVTYIFYGIVFTCILGTFSAVLGGVLAWIVSWPIRFVLWVSKTLSAFPLAAVYTESIYIVIWLLCLYCLLVAYLLMKKKQPLLLTACGCLMLALALIASWLEPLKDDVRMTVLDVGQGQCILLQSEGKTYLVDCGGDSDTAAADLAAQTLLSQGISRLDGVILTHYDTDHAGGVAHLLERIGADALYLPTSMDKDGLSIQLLAYDDGAVILVEEKMQISFGQTLISLYPSQMATNSNESGLCILFQRNDCDILITGDRTDTGERELLRQVDLPDLEVLIVGHHGSKTSTCQELLDAAHADIAIISVGENSYGHPTQEVLDRLETAGCTVYRTDISGTVIYRS